MDRDNPGFLGHTNGFLGIELSNEKKPWLVGFYWGLYYPVPSYIGIIINHEIRIPINHPGFNGK